MKKKSFGKYYFVSLLAALLASCFVCCSDASALNLSNTGDMWIDQIQYERGIYGNQNWSLNTVSPPTNTNQLQWSFSINNMNAGNEISRLYIKYKSEPAGPALISFDISYYITSPNSAFAPIYNGLKFKNRYVLLNDSCINSVGVPMVVGTNNVYAFECSYLIYASSTTSKSIDTEAGSPIFSAAGTNNSLTMRIGPANYVEISNNGLSNDDRTWLEEHLPSGTSTADIESAIESAREDEKEEYEEQQEDVTGGADDAGEEAEAATSNLIETGRSIIETIRDTPATNCVIRIRSGNFDTGNLNLCNVPQQIRTVISTIITIPVTLAALHIAYTTVMLYLNTVRKEQE